MHGRDIRVSFVDDLHERSLHQIRRSHHTAAGTMYIRGFHSRRYRLWKWNVCLASQTWRKTARAVGCVLSGNRIDGQKAAERILTDFRAGLLGKVSLEQPSVARELELQESPTEPTEPALETSSQPVGDVPA